MIEDAGTPDAAGGDARGGQPSESAASPPPVEESPGREETLPPHYIRPELSDPEQTLPPPGLEVATPSSHDLDDALQETLPPPPRPQALDPLEDLDLEVVSHEAVAPFQRAREVRDALASFGHLDEEPEEALAGALLGVNRISGLETPTPRPSMQSFAPGSYSTLLDVRESLSESATEDDQRATLERTLARAARRLERLRRQGVRPLELEGRLRAAETLAEQDELRSALILVEEVLVLSKLMAEFGPPVDPIALQIAEDVKARLKALLGSTELAERITEVVLPLFDQSEERLQEALEARSEETEDTFSYALGERAAALRGFVEERLAALLGEERFGEAAAAATAARPDGLLDRPETLARIEALAERESRWLLETADFREEVDRNVREGLGRFLETPQLAGLIEDEVQRRIEGLLSSSDLDELLAEKIEERRREWVKSRELGELVDARARLLLEEEAFQRKALGLVRETLDSPEFRARFDGLLAGSAALDAAIVECTRTSTTFRELVDERIGTKSRDLLDAPAMVDRLNEVAQEQSDELLGRQSFKSAVDERVNEGAKLAFQSIMEKLDQRLDDFLESPQLRTRLETIAERAAEGEQAKAQSAAFDRGQLEQAVRDLVPSLIRESVSEEPTWHGAQAPTAGGLGEPAVRALLAEELARRLDPAALAHTPEFSAAIEARVQELFDKRAVSEEPTWHGAQPSAEGGLDEGAVRGILIEELARRLDPAALARTAEFNEVIETRFKELLIKEFKKRKKK